MLAHGTPWPPVTPALAVEGEPAMLSVLLRPRDDAQSAPCAGRVLPVVAPHEMGSRQVVRPVQAMGSERRCRRSRRASRTVRGGHEVGTDRGGRRKPMNWRPCGGRKPSGRGKPWKPNKQADWPTPSGRRRSLRRGRPSRAMGSTQAIKMPPVSGSAQVKGSRQARRSAQAAGSVQAI